MAELESRISHAEYMEWMAFYAIDPWGEQRADQRAAQIAQASFTGPVRRVPDLSDLMLYPDGGRKAEDARAQSAEEIATALSKLAGPMPKG